MAISQWRLFISKHDKIIGMGIFTILIFLLGWQTGRIMSPYYASSPIVFEDRTCNACPSSVGTSESLQELREGTKPPVNTSSAPISDPSAQAQQGLYVGSVNSTLFHHYTCSSAQSIKPENQVWYATYEKAVESGRSPSSCTEKLPR
jgi:hypothetical protein